MRKELTFELYLSVICCGECHIRKYKFNHNSGRGKTWEVRGKHRHQNYAVKISCEVNVYYPEHIILNQIRYYNL